MCRRVSTTPSGGSSKRPASLASDDVESSSPTIRRSRECRRRPPRGGTYRRSRNANDFVRAGARRSSFTAKRGDDRGHCSACSEPFRSPLPVLYTRLSLRGDNLFWPLSGSTSATRRRAPAAGAPAQPTNDHRAAAVRDVIENGSSSPRPGDPDRDKLRYASIHGTRTSYVAERARELRLVVGTGTVHADLASRRRRGARFHHGRDDGGDDAHVSASAPNLDAGGPAN